jgi:hypothetical protein
MSKNSEAAAVIEAWILSDFMDDVPGYISRGRKFLVLSDAELVEAWTEAFERSAVVPRNWALLEALNDCNAELILRGIPAPYDRVDEAMEIMKATLQSELSKLTPEQREELEERRRADFEAFVSRGHSDKN